MSLGNPVVQNHACPLELSFSDAVIFSGKLYSQKNLGENKISRKFDARKTNKIIISVEVEYEHTDSKNNQNDRREVEGEIDYMRMEDQRSCLCFLVKHIKEQNRQIF